MGFSTVSVITVELISAIFVAYKTLSLGSALNILSLKMCHDLLKHYKCNKNLQIHALRHICQCAGALSKSEKEKENLTVHFGKNSAE